MTIVLARKRDRESVDDEYLAVGELQALTGTVPEALSVEQAQAKLGYRPPIGHTGSKFFALECRDFKLLDHLVTSLAFWEAIFIPGDIEWKGQRVLAVQSGRLEGTVQRNTKNNNPGANGLYLLSPSVRQKMRTLLIIFISTWQNSSLDWQEP